MRTNKKMAIDNVDMIKELIEKDEIKVENININTESQVKYLEIAFIELDKVSK